MHQPNTAPRYPTQPHTTLAAHHARAPCPAPPHNNGRKRRPKRPKQMMLAPRPFVGYNLSQHTHTRKGVHVTEEQYRYLCDMLSCILAAVERQPAAASSRSSTNPQTRKLDETHFEFCDDAPAGKCRECEGAIYWHSTRSGKNMPLDKDGRCHFDTCYVRNDSKAVDAAADFDPEETPF